MVLTDCSNDNGNEKDVSSEQLFADVRTYFECPDAQLEMIEPRGNSGFNFYKSDDITVVDAVKAYRNSPPDDKTVYEFRDN
jgi:hypothetical protein